MPSPDRPYPATAPTSEALFDRARQVTPGGVNSPVRAFGAQSLQAYSLESYNFIYQERTLTLGLSKLWFWMVMPVFALLSCVHALAALERDIRRLREGDAR